MVFWWDLCHFLQNTYFCGQPNNDTDIISKCSHQGLLLTLINYMDFMGKELSGMSRQVWYKTKRSWKTVLLLERGRTQFCYTQSRHLGGINNNKYPPHYNQITWCCLILLFPSEQEMNKDIIVFLVIIRCG